MTSLGKKCYLVQYHLCADGINFITHESFIVFTALSTMYNARRGLVDTDLSSATKLDMSKIRFVREVWASQTVSCCARLQVIHSYCDTTMIGQQCNFSNEILVQYF